MDNKSDRTPPAGAIIMVRRNGEHDSKPDLAICWPLTDTNFVDYYRTHNHPDRERMLRMLVTLWDLADKFDSYARA